MSAIARIKALLGLDSKDFKRGMKDAQKSVKSFQSTIKSVGVALGAAFSIGAITQMTRSAISFGAEISRTSRNLGINAQALQTLIQVGSDFGINTEQMRDRLGKLAVVLARLRDGTGPYEAALWKAGVNTEKLKGDSATLTGFIEDLGRALSGAGSRFEALSLLSKIFSEENAPRMIELLKRVGSEGMDPLIEKTKKLTGVLSDVDAKKLEDAETNIANLKKKVTISFGTAVGGVSSFWSELKEAVQWPNTLRMMGEPQAAEAADSPAQASRRPKPTTFAAWKNKDFQRFLKQRQRIEDRGGQQGARIEERMAGLSESEKGEGTSVGSLAQIGGMIGANRGFLGIADKQLSVSRKQVELQKELVIVNKEMESALESLDDKMHGESL